MPDSSVQPVDARTRRRVYLLAMGVVVVIIAVAALEAWLGPGDTWPGGDADTMIFRPPDAAPGSRDASPSDPPLPVPLDALRGGDGGALPGADQLLLLRPDDQPLAGLPADLPLPPEATRVNGFRRAAAGVVEEVAFVRATQTSAEAVTAFYDEHAAAAGFRPVKSPVQADPGGRVSRMYIRGEDAAGVPRQTLSVTVFSRADGSLRIVLWLRYPIPRDGAS